MARGNQKILAQAKNAKKKEQKAGGNSQLDAQKKSKALCPECQTPFASAQNVRNLPTFLAAFVPSLVG
jgi:hypothetical protein